MRILFATDHAGFALKEKLVSYVRDELGYDVLDVGAEVFNKDDDYPLFIKKAAVCISQDSKNTMAVVLGGSGTGEAIVANRLPFVRAVSYYGCEREIVTLAREHNNVNVLSLGARFISLEEAKDVVKLFLETPFSEDKRHIRRIESIDGEK